jgi:hypothetical protein
MNKSQSRFCVWCTLSFIALCLVSNATTVIPPTFEQLTDRAELIFIGKVVSSRSEWRNAGGKRAIFTLVEFEKQEVLKGEMGVSITLQFLGGKVGDATMEIDGVPKFRPGDRDFLFIKGNGVQVSPVVGLFHGKFGLRKDENSGRNILIQHDGKVLRDISEIGAGAGAEFGPQRAKLSIPANADPLSLDDFKTKVRERLAISPQKK